MALRKDFYKCCVCGVLGGAGVGVGGLWDCATAALTLPHLVQSLLIYSATNGPSNETVICKTRKEQA